MRQACVGRAKRMTDLAMGDPNPPSPSAAGQLPAKKVGRQWIIEAKDARAFKKLPRGKAGAPRKLK
jgi:hypothetical protein